MSEFLYTRQGDFFVPTDVGGGPWHPSLLHGGTATGLMGHAVQALAPADFVVTRITMDLLRPLPKAPLSVRAQTVRDGTRLKMIEVDVAHDGKTVCRASALLARMQAIPLPDYAPLPHPPPPGPDSMPPLSIQDMLDAKGRNTPRGLHTRVEVRSRDPWRGHGHNFSWLRLPVTILENEPLTPFVRVCLLSDLGNGVAQLNLDAHTGMINADVTLALSRLPAGGWIGFDSETQADATGTGLVHSTLYDESGSFGYVLQSVLANREFGG